jgi:hypothetical protein
MTDEISTTGPIITQTTRLRLPSAEPTHKEGVAHGVGVNQISTGGMKKGRAMVLPSSPESGSIKDSLLYPESNIF